MIGKQIKQLLNAHEITQSQLAKKMNVSDSKLSKIISGSMEPNTQDLILLSQIFQVSIDELIMGKPHEQFSVLENAILNGEESFQKFIQENPEWTTRVDDSGHNIYFYIKKYDAYDLLTSFFRGKAKKTILPEVQIHYVKMMRKLLEKERLEEYKYFSEIDFEWNLSPFASNETEEELLVQASNGSSSLVIHEVVSKSGPVHSQIQRLSKEVGIDFKKKYELDVLELKDFVLYSYFKRDMDAIFDAFLIKNNIHPKYVKNESLRTEYLPTYLSENEDASGLLSQQIQQRKAINIVLLESLFIKKKDNEILDLLTQHIQNYEYLDLLDLSISLQQKPQQYFRLQQKFKSDILTIQTYFTLCVNYERDALFIKMIHQPFLPNFLDYAKQTQLDQLSGYSAFDYKPKPIQFFDFSMPPAYQEALQIALGQNN